MTTARLTPALAVPIALAASETSLGDVTVEELDHPGALAALAPAWEALARRAGATGPFFSPAWFAVYAAELERSREAAATGPRLRLFVAHRRGALAAVLPLVEERGRVAGVPARVLRSLADDHSQRFDAVAEDAQAARALFRHLAADRSWQAIELRDLLPDARGVWLVEAAREAGFPTGTYGSIVSPYLPLPKGAKALEASLDAKFRANLRRRARRLAEAEGNVELERVTGQGSDDAAVHAALDAALDEGFALEASGWKGELGTAIAQSPTLVARYKALAHAFAARGELACFFLKAGGRRVAFHFATLQDGIYYLFKPGYDERLAKYGLGQLLFFEVAKALADEGAREIDFLGDDMPWKREWTQAVRPHAFHYVLRDDAFGRALWAWKFRALPFARVAAARARERGAWLRDRLCDRLAHDAAPASETAAAETAAPAIKNEGDAS